LLKSDFFSRVLEVFPPFPAGLVCFDNDPDSVSSCTGSCFTSLILSFAKYYLGKSPKGLCGFFGAY